MRVTPHRAAPGARGTARRAADQPDRASRGCRCSAVAAPCPDARGTAVPRPTALPDQPSPGLARDRPGDVPSVSDPAATTTSAGAPAAAQARPGNQGRVGRAIRRSALPADQYRPRCHHLRARRFPRGRRVRRRVRHPRAPHGQRSATRFRVRRRRRRGLSARGVCSWPWSLWLLAVLGGRLAPRARRSGAGAGRCACRSAASNRLNASLVSPARVSPTPANCPPGAVPPESRYLRAARQIGHHWHSGGSSVSVSVVAVSQTSSACLAPPSAAERGPHPARHLAADALGARLSSATAGNRQRGRCGRCPAECSYRQINPPDWDVSFID